MSQSKSSSNAAPGPQAAPESGSLLSSREEALRFAHAAERFLERARQNPAVARKLLSDIGYDAMMEDQSREAPFSEKVQNGRVAEDVPAQGVDREETSPSASDPEDFSTPAHQ